MKIKKAKDTGVKILLLICILVVVMFLVIFGYIAIRVGKEPNNKESSALEESSVIAVESRLEDTISSEETRPDGLNPDYSRLILVNGENPLPKDYDYNGNITTIENKYLCGYRNQMDKDAMPYALAMIEAAWKDNVELYILSPYRSYDSQVTLFNNEVTRWKNKGYAQAEAEQKASTVVARPGTSEHHTGLAIDFNSVEDSFENTECFKWLEKNAADYGFIMRYSVEKQPITGVIHESWHWRFVGIKHAKAIKSMDVCLEEYIEYLEKSGSKAE